MRYLLTEKQKNDLRQKYLDNINTLNQYLPSRYRVRPNLSDLNRKLNDPRLQRMYIKGKELGEKRQIRVELFNALSEKYKHLAKPDHKYFMARSVPTLLDLRPGAEKYNEAIVKTYFLHPEAVAQYAYQKAMELNPGDILKIAKSNDFENMAMDYYEKNRASCDLAYLLNDAAPSGVPLTEEAKKYMSKSVIFNHQFISNNGSFMNNMTDGFYTAPTLTERQKELLKESIEFGLENPELARDIDSSLKGMIEEQKQETKAFARNCDGKYDIDKPGAFTYYIMKNKVTKENVSFVEKLDGHIKDDADLVILDEDSAKNIRRLYEKDYIEEENVKFPRPIQNDLMDEYMAEFRYRYALNNNKLLHKMEEKSLSDMINGIRRGFFEAIRNSTSQYTIRLKEAIRQFETPGAEGYQNKEKLKEAAQAYLDHRGVKNRAEALRQSSAAKNRSLLCLDIVAAVEATKDNVKVDLKDDLEKDDDKIIEINENEKEKNLFVDPEEIINEKKLEEDEINTNIIKTNEKKDFTVRIKEKLSEKDSDLDESNEDLSIDDERIIIETGIRNN